MDLEHYVNLLKQLLPSGKLWKVEKGSTFELLLEALASTFFRFDKKTDQLKKEYHPETATELLSDWERITGCESKGLSLEQRRKKVLHHLALSSVSTATSLKEKLSQEGYSVEIRELKGGATSVGQPVYSPEWIFSFQVFYQNPNPQFFKAGFKAGEELYSYRDLALEERVKKLKPAHTEAIFFYLN